MAKGGEGKVARDRQALTWVAAQTVCAGGRLIVARANMGDWACGRLSCRTWIGPVHWVRCETSGRHPVIRSLSH